MRSVFCKQLILQSCKDQCQIVMTMEKNNEVKSLNHNACGDFITVFYCHILPLQVMFSVHYGAQICASNSISYFPAAVTAVPSLKMKQEL